MKWISVLQDGMDEGVSSKRVVTLLAFLVCAVSLLVDQFTQYKVNSTLFDSMMYIVVAGLGFTATEQFARKGKPNE